MKDYHINIFYSEEDEAYIADIPDLKYVSAIAEWLEAAKAENKNIPKPRYRPVIYQIVA